MPKTSRRGAYCACVFSSFRGTQGLGTEQVSGAASVVGICWKRGVTLIEKPNLPNGECSPGSNNARFLHCPERAGRACWPAPGSHSGSKSKWGLRAANLHLPPQRGLPPPCRLCRCGPGPGSAGLDQGCIIQGLLKGRVLCLSMRCGCGKPGTCKGREMPGHRSNPLGDKAYA